MDCIQAGNHDDRQRHHAFDQHDDAVNTRNQRQSAVGRIAVIFRRLRLRMRLRNDAALFDRCDFGFVGDGRAHFFGFAHTIRPSLHNATKIQSQCATREDCLCATRTTCDFCLHKSHVISQSQDVQTAASTCACTEGKLCGRQQQDSQSRRSLSCLFQSWADRIYACAQICPRAGITIREA